MVLIIKHPAAENTATQFNALKRYVRIRGVINDKFVEFDFAIGDPSLYVELVLPKAAFHAFCEHNQVEMMTSEQSDAVDADMEKWRYGESDSLR